MSFGGGCQDKELMTPRWRRHKQSKKLNWEEEMKGQRDKHAWLTTLVLSSQSIYLHHRWHWKFFYSRKIFRAAQMIRFACVWAIWSSLIVSQHTHTSPSCFSLPISLSHSLSHSLSLSLPPVRLPPSALTIKFVHNLLSLCSFQWYHHYLFFGSLSSFIFHFIRKHFVQCKHQTHTHTHSDCLSVCLIKRMHKLLF